MIPHANAAQQGKGRRKNMGDDVHNMSHNTIKEPRQTEADGLLLVDRLDEEDGSSDWLPPSISATTM